MEQVSTNKKVKRPENLDKRVFFCVDFPADNFIYNNNLLWLNIYQKQILKKPRWFFEFDILGSGNTESILEFTKDNISQIIHLFESKPFDWKGKIKNNNPRLILYRYLKLSDAIYVANQVAEFTYKSYNNLEQQYLIEEIYKDQNTYSNDNENLMICSFNSEDENLMISIFDENFYPADWDNFYFMIGKPTFIKLKVINDTEQQIEELPIENQDNNNSEQTAENLFPDEIDQSISNVDQNIQYKEGSTSKVLVNAYERNPQARKKCIEYYGTSCYVCGFNFGKVFGKLGEGFIHVHHLKPIAEIGEEYEINPIEDMRPVCPNCHAMIHRRIPLLSIEEIIAILQQSQNN
jgi:hypothetical protein